MNTQGTVKQKRPISRSAVARIVIWSVVLVILCGVFAVSMLASAMGGILTSFGSFSLGGYFYSDADSYQIGGGTLAETVTDLDIQWAGGQIEILPAAEGVTEITVTEDYNGAEEDDRLRWRLYNGELQIKYRAPSWWIGTGRAPNKKLTIRMPQATLEAMGEVRIQSTNSRITFEGNARELSVDGVDGKLTVNGRVDELDIDWVDADVDFTGTLGSANLDGVDIKAVFRLDAARELEIDGVDQDITIYLADTVTGFRVSRDSLGGSIRTDGFDEVSSRDDYDRYWGDGSLKIEADGVDSKLKIEKLTKD